MEDADFLGYFEKLGPQSSIAQLKVASSSIVATLVTSATVVAKRRTSSVGEEADLKAEERKAKKLQAFKQKYETGDLGEAMSADLNYTLKRLVKGLTSDNHLVKKGFFLAAVEVVRRFKASIDVKKLIMYMKEESKTASTMKNPEINALALGQLMCLSALVESEAYQQGA